MLLSISPLFIKKLILNIFMTNLSVVMNAQAHDSLSLKRDDKPAPHKIQKFEEREYRFKSHDKWPTETENEWNSETDGLLVVECNTCGTKGQLKISGKNDRSKTLSQITFSAGEFRHRESLKPGDYQWEFEDNRNNVSKGILHIKKGETRTLVLFDKGAKA